MSNIIPTPVLSIGIPPKDGSGANITFYVKEQELLKVAADGFYVRGNKIDIDNKEAESVYRAFREFLIWSALLKE